MCQPATRIAPDGISVDGKGMTSESAAALVVEATASAFGGHIVGISQGPQDGALLLNLRQGALKDIARFDRHPPARVKVAVSLVKTGYGRHTVQPVSPRLRR